MAVGDIEATELRDLLRSDRIVACIDVRERGEFAREQIEGVTPLARGTLEYRVRSMIPSRTIPTILCCDDGRRSALAAATLTAMGYQDVSVLRGGLTKWRAQGLPTIEGWGVRGKLYGEQVAVDQAIPQVTADELAARRQAGEPILVVDVRTEEEFARGHVPGAYHVAGGQLPMEIHGLAPDSDQPIVVSCAGRTRGILGAQCLRLLGYRNARALLNGAMGWRLAGYDVEEGEGPRRPPTGVLPESVARLTEQIAREEGIAFAPLDDFDLLRTSGEPFYAVDVRPPHEFLAGHVPGSISIPGGQFALMHENYLAVRALPLIMLANDEVRSIWAAALAKRLGFTEVSVLEAGISGWTVQGRRLEAGSPSGPVFGLEVARRAGAISADRLRQVLERDSRIVVLDVRSSGEFGLGHIPGARWLARGKIELEIESVIPSHTSQVMIACDTGVRSALAAVTLRGLGYPNVQFLDGGLVSWRQDGRPVVDGLDGEP